jgi:hypothetical protein
VEFALTVLTHYLRDLFLGLGGLFCHGGGAYTPV